MSADPSILPADPGLDFERHRARRTRARLLALVADLLVAIERRDVQEVWDVLDESAAARGLPRAVREEALAMVRLPKQSHRAPIHLYRFHEQLLRLGDEPLAWGDPDQLVLDMSPARRPAARGAASRSGAQSRGATVPRLHVGDPRSD